MKQAVNGNQIKKASEIAATNMCVKKLEIQEKCVVPNV
jgi:hypothetical protein